MITFAVRAAADGVSEDKAFLQCGGMKTGPGRSALEVYNCREGKAEDCQQVGKSRGGWAGMRVGEERFLVGFGGVQCTDCRLPTSGITEQGVSVV